MTDYSKMTDEELKAAYEAEQGQKIDYTQLSDAELKQVYADEQKYGYSPEGLTIQEMHPDISAADRAIVKNFGVNKDSQMRFLKKHYPDLEIDTTADGQIRAKRKNEKNYRVLDPDTGFFSSPKEFLRDTGDVLYDIGAGIAEGALTAAGAVAGGLPGGIAFGTGAGFATEAARQGIGSAMGIEDNFSGQDLAVSTIGAGAGAGLLGPGAKGVKGGIGRAFDWAKGTKVGQKALDKGLGVLGFTSGAPKEALQAVAKHGDKVDELVTGQKPVRDFLNETGKEINEAFYPELKRRYGDLKKAVKAAGKSGDVDLSDIKAAFREHIEEAKTDRFTTELADDLTDKYRYFFEDKSAPVEEAVEGFVEKESVPLTQAMDLIDELKEMGGIQRLKSTDMTGSRPIDTVSSKLQGNVEAVGRDLRKRLQESIDGQITGSEAIDVAKKRYGELRNIQREINNLSRSPRSFMTNLRNADQTTNVVNKELFDFADKQLGTNIKDRSNIMTAFEVYGPGTDSTFGRGGLNMSALRRGAVPTAAGFAGYGIASASGMPGYIGAGIGVGVGAALGGKTATKNYIKGAIRANKARQNLGPIRQGLQGKYIRSPWMEQDEENK